MATDLENLTARRTAVIAELAAISSATAGGMPNNPSGVDHQGYKKSLYDELASLNPLIAQADGPIEIVTRGMS
jgi:hypothetical protein